MALAWFLLASASLFALINFVRASSDGAAVQAAAFFKRSDLDASGFLEESEVQLLLNKYHDDLPAYFDWRAFDSDGDSKVSMLEVKEALASFAEYEAQKDGEATDLDEEELEAQEELDAIQEDEDKAMEKGAALFKRFDLDASGFLDEPEIELAKKDQQNMPADFDWHFLDNDKDGKLSLAEVQQAAVDMEKSKILNKVEAADEEEDEEDLDDGADEEEAAKLATALFRVSDSDGSGFIEELEIKSFLEKNTINLPAGVDWRELDDDEDGKLSLDEIKEAAWELQATMAE